MLPFRRLLFTYDLWQKELEEYVSDCLIYPENWKLDEAWQNQCTYFPRGLVWLDSSLESLAHTSSAEYLVFSQISFQFNKAYFKCILDWNPCI